jgi:uncharacterized protein
MKKGKLLGIGFALIVALFLAACGGQKEAGGDGNSKTLTFLTGGTGGTYYPLGGEMAQIMTDKTDYEVTISTSGASTENMTKVQSGDASLALVQTDIASYGVEGTVMFEEAMDKVTAIGALYPETIQIVTTADSGIESVEDLKGKRVSVGDNGSGTFENAKQILEVHGLSIEDLDPQYLPFDESTELLQDGNIDAAFITAGAPTASVESLATTADIKIVPIAEDKINELIEKYPYYAKEVIPGGTYPGLDQDTTTVAVLAMLIANADLSEDQVYELTKALFDNVSDITHEKGSKISAESAVQGIGISFHPGAEKYFKEKGLLGE